MLVYDHTLLAEPNLLIPGKQPVGRVKIAQHNNITNRLACYGDAALGDFVSGVRPNVYGANASIVTDPQMGRVVQSTSTANSGVNFAVPSRFYDLLDCIDQNTIIGWVKINSFESWAAIVTTPHSSSSWVAPYHRLGIINYSGLSTAIYRGSTCGGDTALDGSQTNTGYFIADSLWHMYAAVRSGTVVSYYKDGVLHTTGTIASTLCGWNGNRHPIHMLDRNQGAQGEGINGSAGVFGYWARALSAAEVNLLYRDRYILLEAA